MSNLKLKNRVRARDGLWPAIGKGNGLNDFFNVEYPDLCGTTRMWVQR